MNTTQASVLPSKMPTTKHRNLVGFSDMTMLAIREVVNRIELLQLRGEVLDESEEEPTTTLRLETLWTRPTTPTTSHADYSFSSTTAPKSRL